MANEVVVLAEELERKKLEINKLEQELERSRGQRGLQAQPCPNQIIHEFLSGNIEEADREIKFWSKEARDNHSQYANEKLNCFVERRSVLVELAHQVY